MKQLSSRVFRDRIVEHFEEVDLDVVCRKRKSGYAIYWDDDNEPLAKLRPAGEEDGVEVYSWEEGRWQPVEHLPGVTPLDDALDYITEDPDDVFFAAGDDEDGESALAHAARQFPDGAREYCVQVVRLSLVGGAVGGVFASPLAGAAGGAAAALLSPGVGQLLLLQPRTALMKVVLCGPPAAVVAAAAGALAASVHAQLGGGIGWMICASVLGALCAMFLFFGTLLARPLGLVAGVVAGMQLVDALAFTADTLRFTLVAIIGWGSAAACTANCRWLHGIYAADVTDDDDG